LLTRDFDTNPSSFSPLLLPQSLTTTSTYDFKAGSTLGNTLSAEWNGPNGFKLDKLEFDPKADGAWSTETSMDVPGVDGLKLEFKGNDSNKSDFSFTYKHAQATVQGSVDCSDFKSFDASVSTGKDDIAVGVGAAFKQGAPANINVTASYTAPKMFMGVNLTNNFADVKGLFSFAVDKNTTVAATSTYGTVKKNFGVNLGAAYKCNSSTTIKAKVDMDKNVDLSVKQAINKSLTVTGWAKVTDLSPKSAAFGGKIVLG